jgi:OOP family OmpA-OmpF porin
MNIKTTPALLGIAALAALAAPAAMAQDTGWYAGGSIGRTGATIDDDRIRGGLAGQGLATNSIEDRERDNGFKAFGGYQFNRNIGVEAGYFDLGKFGYTARTTPAGSLTGDMSVKGLNVDVVGTLPLTDRFSVLGRVGVTSAQSVGDFSATGSARVPYASAHSSQRFTNAKWGAGVAYAFTDALSVRLEAERYRINDSVGNRGHVDMLSVGLVYRFGAPAPAPRSASVAPAPAPQPAQRYVAPAPAAVVVAAPLAQPAPVVVTRVNLSADSLFGFDSSTVNANGKVALDKLSTDLRGVQYDSIKVTGHADRLGSASYNDALSSRRANAVADYLVQAGGVVRGKVSASGAGETAPLTKAADCRGASPTPALVTCLQPDRRVEVEVHGTR